jgi:hypothetical protein
MRSLLRALAVLIGMTGVVLLAGPPSPACACDCAPGTVAEQFDAADAVFVGTARTVDSSSGLFGASPQRRVTLDVSLVHKGDVLSRTEVLTADASASCGFDFQVGHMYLVYSSKDGTTLRTTACAGTIDLVSSVDPIAGGATPAPAPPLPGSRLCALVFWAGIAAVPVLLLILVSRRRRRASTA